MIITGKTQVLGIFGHPVGHSLSPLMHNAAFDALGLNYIYVPFQVEPKCIGEAVKAIRALGLRGVNVTIPHKEKVIQHLDVISEEALLIGAVNTIVCEGKILKGYNTDGTGFMRSLKEKGVETEGTHVALIGAGGAARAVGVQLALEGAAKISILIREEDLPAARTISDTIKGNTKAGAEVITLETRGLSKPPGDVNIIVNCTPLGMAPHTEDCPPVILDNLPKETVVCDLVYNPLNTVFLNKARELSMKTVSGIGMLLYQGVTAFELWTGQDAPIQVMAKALKGAI